MPMLLGERIARLRQAYGLSRKDLAERIHVSFEMIRQLESGKIQHPRIHHVQALAKVFGISLDTLCNEETEISVTVTKSKQR